jgi:hypothetical protein
MLRIFVYVIAFFAMTALSEAQSFVQPFGNGAIINTPGAPPTTVQPFGNGYIANTLGRAPTVIQPFGNGYIANTPGQMPTTTVQS